MLVISSYGESAAVAYNIQGSEKKNRGTSTRSANTKERIATKQIQETQTSARL